MSGWRDCIVVLIDLVGVKKKAHEGDTTASNLMGKFHQLICRELNHDMKGLDHAYVWNDSVILFAHVDSGIEAVNSAVRATENLKRKVDMLARSYAIAVMGKAFPHISCSAGSLVTVIRASSYALANCFEIEAEAKRRKLRKSWYIDERIARRIAAARGATSFAVHLLPSGKKRKVYAHAGNLQLEGSSEKK